VGREGAAEMDVYAVLGRAAVAAQADRRTEDHQQPRRGQGSNDRPRGIELRTAYAELGRPRVGVMIIVETLAAGEPGEESAVICAVLEVLRAAPVAQGVDKGGHHEDVEARMQEARDGPGPQSDEPAEQRQPDAQASGTV